jgi:regulatory protein
MARRPRPASPADDLPPVRIAALRLLSRRDHTSAELRRKLLDRGYADERAEHTVRQLTEERLLDDRRVAASHVRTASGVKGRGRLRIARELEARGVDPAIARDALAGLDADDDAAALERVLSRKRLPAHLSMADRRRIFQQLLRRGFSAELIARALHKRA